MNRIKTFDGSVNESKHYQETSWTDTIDGKKQTISIKEVEDFLKNDAIIDINVKDIQDKCIHLNKTDKETLKRSENSDLSFPIIITKKQDGSWGMILDGHHRLKKAIDNDIETIKAKVLDLKEVPDLYKKMFR